MSDRHHDEHTREHRYFTEVAVALVFYGGLTLAIAAVAGLAVRTFCAAAGVCP